jgi:DNA-binding transcriptional ArsR family regulator
MTPDVLDDAFIALADPVRRRVVEMLRTRPHRAGEIAAAFDLSGPAISKHLRVLRRCRVVVEEADAADARVRIYRLRPEPFEEVGEWIERVRSFWTDQLESFRAYAAAHAQAEHRRPRKKSAASIAKAPRRRARRRS